MPVKTMPLGAARKDQRVCRKSIRGHWSDQERMRRREMADMMQQRLITALCGKTAAG